MTSELKCPDCSKVCKTKSSLTLHMKSHSDMHKKEEELTKVINEEKKSSQQAKKDLTHTQDVVKNIISELEALKVNTSARIQEQIDSLKQLL